MCRLVGRGGPASLPLTFLIPRWDSGIFFLLVPLAARVSKGRWAPAWVRWPVAAVLAVMLVSMVRNVLIDGAGNYVLGGLLAADSSRSTGALICSAMVAELRYQGVGIAMYFLHQSGAIHAVASRLPPRTVLLFAGAAGGSVGARARSGAGE
jgi:hypothetical protein